MPNGGVDIISPYVCGPVKATVMKNMEYHLVLGCRYVFLVTPDFPIVLAPVTTCTLTDAETPQQETLPSNQEF
jgi:hypothetical protein